MKNILLPLVFGLITTTTLYSQKRVLDHTDYALWSTVEGEALSPDGKHAVFSLLKGEKDHLLKVKEVTGVTLLEHDRAEKGQFTYDSSFLLFTIKAWKDSVTAMTSRKLKKKDLPKDSLVNAS